MFSHNTKNRTTQKICSCLGPDISPALTNLVTYYGKGMHILVSLTARCISAYVCQTEDFNGCTVCHAMCVMF